MSKELSFHNRKVAIYTTDAETTTCEKIRQIGDSHIVIIRNKTYAEKSIAEIAIYDLDLNLKTSDNWDGDAMDVTVSDNKIIVSGEVDNKSAIRIYEYNDDSLKLLSQTSWESTSGLYSTAKSLHVADVDGDGQLEIIVLCIVEGRESNSGYAQIRIYDADMQLKMVKRWNPMYGTVTKWGHCLSVADLDGDGKDELIVLVNFNHQGKKKSDLRVFDHNLLMKQSSDIFSGESTFATCMSTGDIDGDGKPEIVIGGGTFTGKWRGATNQITIIDHDLKPKSKIAYRTFRHSWLWDLQIADVDQDGQKEIITYGGTSMTGKNQEEANIIGEICIRDGKTLEPKDMLLWQSNPGIDTRPSRGIVINNKFIVATSKWSKSQNTRELEIRSFDYVPNVGAVDEQLRFIKACNDKDAETLADYTSLDDTILAPLALEGLALCHNDQSIEAMGVILQTTHVPPCNGKTEDQLLFQRTVQLLRNEGKPAIPQLRKVGFSIQNDWIILSPFDNVDNKGFNTEYPPEVKLDFDEFYAGKERIIRWGKVGEDVWDDRRQDIYTDLAYTHFDSFERTGLEYNWNYRSTKSIAYLITYVYPPEEMAAQIKLGSADGIKVWIDNELVFTNDIVRHPEFDQDSFTVHLLEGKNTIILKISSNNKDTWGDWGFYFRITDWENKGISGLRYEQPEVAHIHNQMFAQKQLVELLKSNDEYLRYLAGVQLIPTGDKRGNEALVELLKSKDKAIQAKSSLALTLEGDKRGIETLVESASTQESLFKFSASNALERMGDTRGEQFSAFNVKDKDGKPLVEMKVTDTNSGFRISPIYKSEETSHVDVHTNLLFHLGDNVSAKCASIASFGIREPEYRAMGIGATTIKRSCEIMEEMGHTCIIVSTGLRLVAHRLYCRMGFFDRRLQSRFEKHLGKADDLNPDMIIRDYLVSDKDEIMRLRDQYCLTSVGPNTWSPPTYFGEETKVLEYNGKIAGYASVYIDPYENFADVKFFHIDKDIRERKIASKALLSGIDRYALAEGKETVKFFHSPNYLKDSLYAMGYDLDESMRRHEWVGMFRIIDLPKFLREISPLLTLRINKSIHEGWQGALAIQGERLKATMIFDGNGVVGVENGADEKADLRIIADDRLITSLVTNDAHIWELYRQNIFTTRPTLNERVRSLIETLFPMYPCTMSGWW
jgi:hypothetical protein